MCGIFGVTNFNAGNIPSPRLLNGFAKTATRGPDGKGLLLFRGKGAAPEDVQQRPDFELGPGDVLLGHHRLSIIDVVDQANQPMRNEDGKVWVVFNGEIYNAKSLRAELIQKGHRFATESSDTEVLVHGWEEWGRELPRKLSGIFALAVLDQVRGELVLLRDFPGTKPLYYQLGGDYVAFASTATAVAAVSTERSYDRDALAHWLTYGYTSVEDSLYAGVSKLMPGTGLAIRLADGRPETFSFKPELHFGTTPFSEDRFEEIFSEVLREQLHSDVPVGFYLSGGVDSALVATYARRLFPEREFNCYSMRFPGAAHDESQYSAAVAAELRFRQHVVDAPEVSLQSISDFTMAMDEPISDPSFFTTWHLSKAIGRSVKVCVGGDGGDELFSGYERYQVALGALQRSRRWPLVSRATRAGFKPLLRSGRAGRKLIAYFGAPAQVNVALETIGLTGLAAPEALARLLNDVGAAVPHDGEALLAGMQAHDLCAPLSEDILFKVDRTSMANHFEARVPFLDQRLVRYALSCSLKDNLTKETTKIPLRRLCAKLGIERLLNPRKQGFGFDLQANQERLDQSFAQLGGCPRVAQLFDCAPNFYQTLQRPMSKWALLVLELWAGANR